MTRKATIINFAFILLLSSLMVSCRVGYDYRRPDCEMPDTWCAEEEPAPWEPVDEYWWESFGDEQLTRYIYLAAGNNKDIQTALANICQARAQRTVTAAQFYPDIDAELRYNRNSFNTFFGGAGNANPQNVSTITTNFKQEIFFVGWDAVWEIDIFGRTRREVEAASWRIGSSLEHYRDVLVTVFAETANNYLNARGIQELIAAKEKEIVLLEEILLLNGRLNQAGLISDIQLKDLEAALSRLKSELPQSYVDFYTSVYRLSVLTGQFPCGLLEEMKESKPMPNLPEIVSTGLPSELLLRRPDIRQAETELAAAVADVGVAIGDLFPRFFLAGSTGNQKFTLPAGVLENFVWSYTVDILTPFFKAGKIQANIQGVKSKAAEAFYQYENTILQAVEETLNHIVGYYREQERFSYLNQMFQEEFESLELTTLLNESGIVDDINALDKERTTLQARQAMINSKLQASSQLIGLYKALGGGWEDGTAEEMICEADCP